MPQESSQYPSEDGQDRPSAQTETYETEESAPLEGLTETESVVPTEEAADWANSKPSVPPVQADPPVIPSPESVPDVYDGSTVLAAWKKWLPLFSKRQKSSISNGLRRF